MGPQFGTVAPTISLTPYFTKEASWSTFILDPLVIVILILLLLFAVTGIVLLYLYSKYIKDNDRYEKSLKYTFYVVRAPYKNEFQFKAAEQMFSSLYGITKKKKLADKLFKADEGISFEIIAYPDFIGFFVHTPTKYAQLVEKQILGAYQSVEVVEMVEPNIFKEGSYVTAGEFGLSGKPYQPIKTYVDYEEKSDPLSSIVGSLANMVDGEGASIQVLITSADGDWSKDGQKFVMKKQQEVGEVDDKGKRKNKIDILQEQQQAIIKKCSKVGFRVFIRVAASGPTKDIAEARLNVIAGAFAQFGNPGLNSLKFKKVEENRLRTFMFDFIYRRVPYKGGAILNVEELATVYHFPNKLVETPGVDWLFSKKAAPPQNLPTSGLWIGTSVFRGQKRPVYIGSINDRRRHMYIIGQTGVGKSWAQANMILQDIYNGHGLAVIDPHGSLVEEIIKRIPVDRAEDVIYFNPSDTERPFGLNMLEHRNEYERHMVVNSFLGLMRKMFDPHDQGIVGPRFNRAVRNAMLTVMVDPNSTLVEVLRAIADEDYAKSFLDRVEDPEVIAYWEKEIANTDKFHKSEILGWITSKFDQFVTNIMIRQIIGQSKSSFNMREVMDSKKILLVNLAKGIIGEENAQFLGLIIVPIILRAALSREDIPEDERKDFFLYVDEFQNFATEDFAQILSEARKYRLNLIIAHQYISQLNEKVRDAVFGNVGNMLIMRISATDAEYMAKEFNPVFEQQDFVKLENANAYVKLLINGVVTQPFSISTFYKMEERYPKQEQVEKLVRELSRIKYGRPYQLVREEMKKRGEYKSVSIATGFVPPPSLF